MRKTCRKGVFQAELIDTEIFDEPVKPISLEELRK